MKMFKQLYVYILKCAYNSYYVGVTNDPEVRLLQHNRGINPDCYTFRRRPLELKYSEGFADFLQAIDWEKQIKKWTRKKKEALINRNWDELKKLAICKNEPSNLNYKKSFDSAQDD